MEWRWSSIVFSMVGPGTATGHPKANYVLFYQKEMTNVWGDRFVYPDMDIIYSIKVSK